MRIQRDYAIHNFVAWMQRDAIRRAVAQIPGLR